MQTGNGHPFHSSTGIVVGSLVNRRLGCWVQVIWPCNSLQQEGHALFQSIQRVMIRIVAPVITK